MAVPPRGDGLDDGVLGIDEAQGESDREDSGHHGHDQADEEATRGPRRSRALLQGSIASQAGQCREDDPGHDDGDTQQDDQAGLGGEVRRLLEYPRALQHHRHRHAHGGRDTGKNGPGQCRADPQHADAVEHVGDSPTDGKQVAQQDRPPADFRIDFPRPGHAAEDHRPGEDDQRDQHGQEPVMLEAQGAHELHRPGDGARAQPGQGD